MDNVRLQVILTGLRKNPEHFPFEMSVEFDKARDFLNGSFFMVGDFKHYTLCSQQANWLIEDIGFSLPDDIIEWQLIIQPLHSFQ